MSLLAQEERQGRADFTTEVCHHRCEALILLLFCLMKYPQCNVYKIYIESSAGFRRGHRDLCNRGVYVEPFVESCRRYATKRRICGMDVEPAASIGAIDSQWCLPDEAR